MKALNLLVFFITLTAIAQQNATAVGVLPAQVSETSGLIYYNNRLITHNDSGNFAELIEIDTTDLSVIRIVSISNAVNVDWEDLTQDANYIYIGDIGNFNGDRRDLTVYRISKLEYDSSDTVAAEAISFSYEDQTDFTTNPSSDWDAEALIIVAGQLIVFTKQWQSNATIAYGLPALPGNHSAANLGGYNSNGLITAATWNPITNVVFLLGYSAQLLPFVVRIDDIVTNFSFNGSEDRSSIPIGLAQVEAITYVNFNTYYLSSERFVNDNPPISLIQTLYRFTTTDIDPGIDDPNDPPIGEPPNGNIELIIYREFGSWDLQYDLNVEEIFGRAIFDTAGRRIQFTNGENIDNNIIDISSLGSSVYYLTFYLRTGVISKAFVAN